MALTNAQRHHRLLVRTEELTYWQLRETRDIIDWQCDGQPFHLGMAWPQKDAPLVFTAEAVVPAHWPLAETRLLLDVGGESLLDLAFDGGEAQHFGLDPYHQEFRVLGRQVGIRTESVPRLPFGEPVRNPALNMARLVWVEPALEQFILLLLQVGEAVSALDQHEVVPHLLDVAEQALRQLKWPSHTQDYIARIAPSHDQQKIWQLPAYKADPEGLDEEARASVSAAFAGLTAGLSNLQQRFPPQGDVLLTGHAHIDLAWLWPYGETRRKMRRTFSTALDLMTQSPDFRFNQSTAAYYAQIEADDPPLFDAIRARVNQGVWETIGGMWVEPDTNMPTGESLARQILYGQRYFEEKFGLRHTVCWLPDCFGFSPAMPQLLRLGGIENFFTTKVNWSETNRFPYDLFWWEGLDGSRVLTHTFNNPMEGYNGFVQPDCIMPTWRNFRQKVQHGQTLLAVGYGDGGGGVTPEMLDREVQLRNFPALPQARWGRVDEFFQQAQQTAAEKKLPVWQGEIYLELHRATLTTQSHVKRAHRQAERALITAEIIGSVAALTGAELPPSLEPVWRTVLKNEFHDILPGSSIREVNVEAVDELETVRDEGLTEQQNAMARLIEQLPPGDVDDAIVVVNPSLSEERPLRLVLDGQVIATADVLPPLGIGVFSRKALVPAPDLKVSPRELENDHLIATLDEDGTLVSLIHRRTGRDALAGAGNQLWVYPADKPRNWDAWDIDEDYAEVGEQLRAHAIDVVDAGPHRAAIRVHYKFRNSSVTQTYALAANGRRLDIETHIDWRDRRCLLRSLTPADVRSETASFECAYGVIRRPTHANTSWDQARFEVAAHRFADLSEPGFGLAILNNAKYGHSVRGNLLGLSLVRSPVYPDPLADEGEQDFTYALMPHADDWCSAGVGDEADDLNQPLVWHAASGLEAGIYSSSVCCGSTTAVLSGFKRAEDDNGLILRVYEPQGARGPFELGAMPWQVSGPLNLLEEPIERDSTHGLNPFEVRTYRLTRA